MFGCYKSKIAFKVGKLCLEVYLVARVRFQQPFGVGSPHDLNSYPYTIVKKTELFAPTHSIFQLNTLKTFTI